MADDLQTRRCVRCMKAPAEVYFGHVTLGSQQVTSGWCEPCLARSETGAYEGWDGHYNPEMGLEPLHADTERQGKSNG